MEKTYSCSKTGGKYEWDRGRGNGRCGGRRTWDGIGKRKEKNNVIIF